MRALVLLALLPSLAFAQAISTGGSSSAAVDQCYGQACEVASLSSTGTVQSAALSGQYAFETLTNGARIGLGGGNAYLFAVDNNTVQTNATIRAAGGVDVRNALITDSVRGSVLVGNVGSLILLPVGSLPTCAASATVSPSRSQAGGFAVLTNAAGVPNKTCVCTYDGTSYKWFNISAMDVTTGTTTSCPDLPAAPTLRGYSGSASLDFPSISPNTKSDPQTVTVTGAATGDRAVCTPSADLGDLSIVNVIVSASNTVSLRLYNFNSSSPVDPAAITFSCSVIR